MKKGAIQKKEVEELIGCGIADSLFSEALQRAVQKQRKIYGNGGREAVLQRRYLLALTGECARSLIISCSLWTSYAGRSDMEKERWAGAAAQKLDSHIVPHPAV